MFMDPINITAKGIDDKLLLKIPEIDWPELKMAIGEYIISNGSFLQGAKVILEFGNNLLKSKELYEIKNLLLDHQINIAYISTQIPETKQAAELLGIRTSVERKTKPVVDREVDSTILGEAGIVVKRTIRSGNLVSYDGNITVIGDINPGAIIKAKENIVVWGRIKGEVHAGLSGNENCVICALELTPLHLAIAETSLVEQRKKAGKIPEQAALVRNAIKITPWKI
jgi:septum site-determining protein MinC